MLRSRLRPLLAGFAICALTAPLLAQASDGNTFLKAVRERDGTKVTDMLGPGGASILVDTRAGGTGETALHIVARRRDDQWLGFLLSRGANPNARDRAGDTPLMAAARIGFVDGAETLIARRAQVDLANNAGETPLIVAVQNRDLALVRTLLAAGADAEHADSVAGMSARDYAVRDGRSATILRLIDEPREQAPRRAVAGPGLF